MINKVIRFDSGNKRVAVAIRNEYKELILSIRDEFGFQTSIFLSDEQAEKLALFFADYVKEIKNE